MKVEKSEVLAKAQQRIDELLKAEEDALKECQRMIDKYESIIGSEEEKKAIAYENCDGAAHKKAEDAITNAKSCAGMYRKKLANSKSDSLISEEEYKALIEAIKTELDSINLMATKSVVSLTNEIVEICNIVGANIAEGNKLLHDLQHSIKKDDACLVGAGGTRVHSESLEQRYNDYTLRKFKERIIGVHPEATVGNLFKVLKDKVSASENE